MRLADRRLKCLAPFNAINLIIKKKLCQQKVVENPRTSSAIQFNKPTEGKKHLVGPTTYLHMMAV